MQELIRLIDSKKNFLTKCFIECAKAQGYVKYMPTLEEAWAASASRLASAIIDSLQRGEELGPVAIDFDYTQDPNSAFGIEEARRHRQRGITLVMFLSLFKHYRKVFIELVEESYSETNTVNRYKSVLSNFFNRNEIAFCAEWEKLSGEDKLLELQASNRMLVAEKNKYLTIYESIPTAAVVFDPEGQCVNINYAAQQLLFKEMKPPGFIYYATERENYKISEMLPWVYKEYAEFDTSVGTEKSFEKTFHSPRRGVKSLLVTFQKMLDVSNRYDGTIILFADLTEYKRIEQELRHLSYHDQQTGLYNRAYLDMKLSQLVTGESDPVAFISVDIDCFKLINEEYGHGKGDDILIAVTKILKKCFRKSDTIVRVGGDEFFVLIPSCHKTTAEKAYHTIQNKIQEYNAQSAHIPISLSLGYATGTAAENHSFLLKLAFDRMKAEKKGNCPKYEALLSAYQHRNMTE